MNTKPVAILLITILFVSCGTMSSPLNTQTHPNNDNSLTKPTGNGFIKVYETVIFNMELKSWTGQTRKDLIKALGVPSNSIQIEENSYLYEYADANIANKISFFLDNDIITEITSNGELNNLINLFPSPAPNFYENNSEARIIKNRYIRFYKVFIHGMAFTPEMLNWQYRTYYELERDLLPLSSGKLDYMNEVLLQEFEILINKKEGSASKTGIIAVINISENNLTPDTITQYLSYVKCFKKYYPEEFENIFIPFQNGMKDWRSTPIEELEKLEYYSMSSIVKTKADAYKSVQVYKSVSKEDFIAAIDETVPSPGCILYWVEAIRLYKELYP